MRKLSLTSVRLVVGLFLFLGLLVLCSPGRLSAQNNNNNRNNNNNNNRNNNNNNNRNNNNNNNNNNGNNGGYDDYVSFMRWGYRSAVGGFSIDAQGAFQAAAEEEVASMSQTVRSLLAEVPESLDQSSPMRKVSLKRLSALLADCAANNTEVPDAALYLGGLTGIDYVVAVPEENDIYLAGPAEGWTVNDAGLVVGKDSGKPVLLLEDLLTVLRAWNTDRPEVISCSIDPSQEAIVRMKNLMMTADPAAHEQAGREAMGYMNVTFTGIPTDSRMAQVLAAADYKMKTLSLGFEDSPLKKFPSYFSMLKRGSGSYGQRFWIAPEYATLKRDSQSLAWNLSATTVKTMTEREYFKADGSRERSGQKDANATKWADMMTKRYGELAEAVPVFAEAKNCMDIALVVGLVFMENLQNRAGCDISALTSVALPSVEAPSKVPSDALCRVINDRNMVSVVGGISINPFEAIENNTAEDNSVAELAKTIRISGTDWVAD